MYIIGLTGGIGSGKSKVADHFAHLGAGLVDADVIAREVVAPGSLGLGKIIEHFGETILAEDGTLNRAKLREHVFSQEADRLWLNQLLHPMIRQEMLQQCQAQRTPYCLLVIPLMVENRLQALCQRVLLVDVPVQVQIERTVKRDRVTPAQAAAIVQRQASRWQRLRIADDVLNNNRSWPECENEILHLHQLYLEFALKAES